MVFVVLGVILLAMWLAGMGPVGAWPWWAVFWPFAVAVLWWWFADTSGWTKRREVNKMEEKKRQRRIDALDKLGMDAKGRRGRSESAKQARRRF
jgi:small Trp-rich protein